MNRVSPSLTICFLWSAIIDIVMIVLLTSSTIALSFSNGQRASYVLGQLDFGSNSKFAGGLTISSRSLNFPSDLVFDSKGNLWVVDSFNNRVVRYTPPFTNGKAADLVLGQRNFFSAGYKPVTASSLQSPMGLTFDSKGNLWVADSFNNRVLGYSKSP